MRRTEREPRKVNHSVTEDPTIVDYGDNGVGISAGSYARIFALRPVERQARYAYGCIEKRNIDPAYVLRWVTDSDVRDQVRVWCIGKGIIKLDDDQDVPEKDTTSILQKDEEIIEALSPYVNQIDLARIVTLRRYRDESIDDQHTLVCGTYRLLGDYLGPRRYYKNGEQSPHLLSLPDLAPEIFADDIVSNILFESERRALVGVFSKSREEGFRYLQQLRTLVDDPLQIAFVDKLEEHFTKSLSLIVPGFKTHILGSQKDVPESERLEEEAEFPAPHQQEYAYQFINKAIGTKDLLIGATGTMKTKGALYAMRAAGAKSIAIVCPPGLPRLHWEREIKEAYEEEVEVIRIEGRRDFERLINSPPTKNPDKIRHFILSYSLLSMIKSQEAKTIFEKFRTTCDLDALTVDEVHLAKEASAKCTQQLYVLSRCLAEESPRIAMTATGVVNSVEDLDAPVRILLPYKYQSEGDFTRAARNDPHLVAALLHGQQLMTRWTKEAILGEKLPPVTYRDEPIPFSPFQQALYEYVYRDDTIAESKRGMLRQVSLDPLLIRKYYYPSSVQESIGKLEQKRLQKQDERAQEVSSERIKALNERVNRISALITSSDAAQALRQAHKVFEQWQAAQDSEAIFNEDFLVTIGYEDLAVWGFFTLRNGLSDLIETLDDPVVREDWETVMEMPSSKYKRLFELLDQIEGKVLIYSGFYQQYVSSGIEDVEIDDQLAFMSLYDNLRTRYGDETVRKIDGSVLVEPKKGELAAREQIRRSWRLDPKVTKLLATVRASRLGIDLTIPNTQANEHIKKTTIIYLDPPDTHADRIQPTGRVDRPGQKTPLEVIYFKSTTREQPKTVRYGLIDHGIYEALEFKRLIAQMVEDGIPLTKEEEEFVKAHLTTIRVEHYALPVTPQRHLINTFFRDIRGKGFRRNSEYFKEKGFEGMINADFFAAFYPQNDEMSLAGHNGRAVSQVIKKYQQVQEKDRFVIGSVGSGAGILQVMLGQPIVQIDMLPDMLQVAKARQNSSGEYLVADAARLPIKKEAFDITDASLMLHWSDNRYSRQKNGEVTSERIRILRELNGVTKVGGIVILTVPYGNLNNQQFLLWRETMEKYFGLRCLVGFPSGLLRATDFKVEPISWMFTLEKVGDPRGDLPRNVLAFDFDRVFDIKSGRQSHSNENGQAVFVRTPLPHTEFEVYEPGTGGKEQIIYERELYSQKDLEQLLYAAENLRLSPNAILTELGVEEFGMYRRLSRDAKNAWELSVTEADKLALEAIIAWEEHGGQRHDGKKIWTEMRGFMVDIYRKEKMYDN